jgi:hypothetical protein
MRKNTQNHYSATGLIWEDGSLCGLNCVKSHGFHLENAGKIGELGHFTDRKKLYLFEKVFIHAH